MEYLSKFMEWVLTMPNWAPDWFFGLDWYCHVGVGFVLGCVASALTCFAFLQWIARQTD